MLSTDLYEPCQSRARTNYVQSRRSLASLYEHGRWLSWGHSARAFRKKYSCTLLVISTGRAWKQLGMQARMFGFLSSSLCLSLVCFWGVLLSLSLAVSFCTEHFPCWIPGGNQSFCCPGQAVWPTWHEVRHGDGYLPARSLANTRERDWLRERASKCLGC